MQVVTNVELPDYVVELKPYVPEEEPSTLYDLDYLVELKNGHNF